MDTSTFLYIAICWSRYYFIIYYVYRIIIWFDLSSDLSFYIVYNVQFNNLLLSWNFEYKIYRNYPSISECCIIGILARWSGYTATAAKSNSDNSGEKIFSFRRTNNFIPQKRPVFKYSIFIYSMWKRSPGSRCRTWRICEKLPRATWIKRKRLSLSLLGREMNYQSPNQLVRIWIKQKSVARRGTAC